MSFLLNIFMSNNFFLHFFIFYILHNYVRAYMLSFIILKKYFFHDLILGKKFILPTIFTNKTIPLCYNYSDTIQSNRFCSNGNFFAEKLLLPPVRKAKNYINYDLNLKNHFSHNFHLGVMQLTHIIYIVSEQL